MKTKTNLIILSSFILLMGCSGKPKQTLPDKLPQRTNDETVYLNTWISPAPPGKTDANDTTSVIAPDKVSTSDKILEVLDVYYLLRKLGNGSK